MYCCSLSVLLTDDVNHFTHLETLLFTTKVPHHKVMAILSCNNAIGVK